MRASLLASAQVALLWQLRCCTVSAQVRNQWAEEASDREKALNRKKEDYNLLGQRRLAELAQPELRGLGTLLVARAQQLGHKLGFRRCIHALMFENNASLKISRHYAAVMRKYTLYSWDLAK